MTNLAIAPIRCYGQWAAADGASSILPHPLGYRVTGNVSRFGVAGVYRVRLHLRKNGVLYAETWSNAAGEYSFDLCPNEPYYVVAFDDTAEPVNAAISDYVTPEPMP